MSNFRKLLIAAKDGYCGAVHYCDDDSYVRSKNIEAVFELGKRSAKLLIGRST